MLNSRFPLARLLLSLVVVLLLCGIVSREFPELLSLTDNPTNDFTVCRATSADSTHLAADAKQCAIQVVPNAVMQAPPEFSALAKDVAQATTSPVSIFSCVLRT
jgi:hypothetical protein